MTASNQPDQELENKYPSKVTDIELGALINQVRVNGQQINDLNTKMDQRFNELSTSIDGLKQEIHLISDGLKQEIHLISVGIKEQTIKQLNTVIYCSLSAVVAGLAGYFFRHLP